jgi:glycosyltransferase involved in cell wall biosynthesis
VSPDPEAESGVRLLLVMAASTGGIGRHVKTLAEGLPKRGFAVTVCGPGATLAALDLDPASVRLVTVPLDDAGLRALRESRRVLRAEAGRVDVVHAQGLRAGGACAHIAAKAPLIVTWHNAPIGGRRWRFTHAALARYVARSADLTLAASGDLAADARSAGARVVRTEFVAAPTLPAPSRSPATVRAELGVGERPLVLAIGRLQEQKQFDVLVAAAARWAAHEESPYVVIAGDGPDRAALADQIATTAAPVTLLGQREDIADLLGAADVVALPSLWEARALVAQEALRAGVPLVATGVGGLPSLLGDAAIIVPVGDAPALRIAIESVLSDHDRRARMIAAGFARAAGWPDQEDSLDELAQTYRDLIGPDRAGQPGED